jgi:hypothetical protein
MSTKQKPIKKESMFHTITFFFQLIIKWNLFDINQCAYICMFQSCVLNSNGQWLVPINKSPVRKHSWTYYEERALVEFIGVSKTDPKYGFPFESQAEWPSFGPSNVFWSDAANHIQQSTISNVILTSMYHLWCLLCIFCKVA